MSTDVLVLVLDASPLTTLRGQGTWPRCGSSSPRTSA
jgi:hypothetical protein